DESFPSNESVRIKQGEPIIQKLERKPIPAQLKVLDKIIAQRLEPVSILDVLADTEHWLQWTRAFGPLSGHEAKLDNPQERYLVTTFCYGCHLGPTQTARSLAGHDRRQIAWINQRHITEDHLDRAITTLINAYN